MLFLFLPTGCMRLIEWVEFKTGVIQVNIAMRKCDATDEMSCTQHELEIVILTMLIFSKLKLKPNTTITPLLPMTSSWYATQALMTEWTLININKAETSARLIIESIGRKLFDKNVANRLIVLRSPTGNTLNNILSLICFFHRKVELLLVYVHWRLLVSTPVL